MARTKRSRKSKRFSRDEMGPIPSLRLGKTLSLGFPHKMVSKLRYREGFTINSVAGAVGSQVYRWNSTFDPNASLGGHQPLYRDTFAAVYDHYAVISATAVVKFVNTTANPWVVGCVTDDDTTPSTGVDTLSEQTTSKHVLLPPVTGSLSSHVFNMNWDCKAILGIDPFASQTYKTAVGSNPSEESDLVLWGADSAAGTTGVYGDILITYTILWSELTTPTQS